VARILEVLADEEAIVVGGQSINLWVEIYSDRLPEMLEDGPFLSKDIDFLHNRRAERALVNALDGKLLFPSPGAHTPNAAVFQGTINGQPLLIDFMHDVLGVKSEAIRRRSVTLEGSGPDGQPISISLMHPMHCFQSRLANINQLRRLDGMALRQARASVQVFRAFLDDLLNRGEYRQVQSLLREYAYTLRDSYFGRPSHLEVGLHAEDILDSFMADSRLDTRWRRHQLATLVSDAERRRRRAIGPADR